MVGFQWLSVPALAFLITSAWAVDDDWTLKLLKRQAPGTPAYDCHSNCGQAVVASRGSDPCNNATFTTAYEACLKCAGPGKFNIWEYYGGTLTVAGTKCGLSTTPVSGSAPSSSYVGFSTTSTKVPSTAQPPTSITAIATSEPITTVASSASLDNTAAPVSTSTSVSQDLQEIGATATSLETALTTTSPTVIGNSSTATTPPAQFTGLASKQIPYILSTIGFLLLSLLLTDF